MPPASASALVAERPARNLLADYAAHLARTGRRNCQSPGERPGFLQRWPDPDRWASQPLPDRFAEGRPDAVVPHRS